MTEEGRQVTVRRPLSRSWTMWLSGLATLVGGVGVVVWGLVTRDGLDLVIAGLLAVLLCVGAAFVVWRRVWVDTGAGTISRSFVGVLTRTVAWAEASVVDLETTVARQLNLRVKGPAGTIRATLVAADLGGDRSIEPGQLRLLADEIERWAPEGDRVVTAPRAQAEPLEAGGDVRESPLAQRL